MSGGVAAVRVDWAGEGRFDATRTAGGPSIRLDSSGATGPSPVDGLLAALASCISVDVVEILTKRRTPPTTYTVHVRGERVETVPRRIRHVTLEFVIAGRGIERIHAEHAVELSITKYCSVRDSLREDIGIEWTVTIESDGAAPRRGATPTALAPDRFDVTGDHSRVTPKRAASLQATRRARIGVVGTGHGVGTTTVAAAIAAGMRTSGVRVGALKPLSCGGIADAERLRAATGSVDPLELVAPARFGEALAPLVAARRARTAVDLGALDHAFAMMLTMREAVIVDATGPLLTPITETESFATLFARWQLDVVLVAPNSRDAVGSVLAAASVAQTHALALQAVVLTTLAPAAPFGGGAERTNQAVLKELLRTVPVIALPHTPSPGDPGALAALAREFASRAAFTRPA